MMKKIRDFISSNEKLKKMRKLNHEEMLIFYLDEDDDIRLGWGNIGNHLRVELDLKALSDIRKKTGCTRFFIIHNHPEAKSDKYHYFSAKDISLYEDVLDEIKGSDIKLLDFYVISPKGDFSMEEFSSIF